MINSSSIIQGFPACSGAYWASPPNMVRQNTHRRKKCNSTRASAKHHEKYDTCCRWLNKKKRLAIRIIIGCVCVECFDFNVSMFTVINEECLLRRKWRHKNLDCIKKCSELMFFSRYHIYNLHCLRAKSELHMTKHHVGKLYSVHHSRKHVFLLILKFVLAYLRSQSKSLPVRRVEQYRTRLVLGWVIVSV